MEVGVKRNLWATRQSGLLAPKRMNFPIDSLALYMPLWHPELSGSPIVSKDLNTISGTVTGAVHSPPLGRVFDGDDDIDLGNDPALDITTSFSIFAWIKPNIDGSLAIITKDDGTGGDRGWYFSINADKTRIFVASDGTKNGRNDADSANVVNATWVSLGCSVATGGRCDAALKLYTSGVLEASTWTAGGGQLGGDTQTVNNAASETDIGQRAVPDLDFDGTIGEVIVWTRVITAEEFLHIHNATKWRYV